MENNVDAIFIKNDDIVQSIRNFGITSIFRIEKKTQSIDKVMEDFELNSVIVKEVEKRNPMINTTFNKSNMTTNLNQLFLGKNNIKKKYIKFAKHSDYMSCVFCENNHEPEAVYKSHSVRDSFGKVLCPKLRTYICPICKAYGDNAHTVKYCPEKRIITMEDTEQYEHIRSMRTAYFQQEVNTSISYKLCRS